MGQSATEASRRGGYLVRRFAEAPTVPCACGQSTRLLTAEDGQPANFHITSIQDSAKHYHRECTELYYILEGEGDLELNDDTIHVEPGMLIVIEPYTTHRLRSEQGVKTLVIGIPAWDSEDEVFVDDNAVQVAQP